MGNAIGLSVLHGAGAGGALFCLARSYLVTARSMDSTFGTRVQKLNLIRYLTVALGVCAWCAFGISMGVAALSLDWRWSFSAIAALVYICEVITGFAALGRFPDSAWLGVAQTKAACCMRLVGLASLPFVTAFVKSRSQLYVLSVWSAFVGVLFGLVLMWPRFPRLGPDDSSVYGPQVLRRSSIQLQRSTDSSGARKRSPITEVEELREDLTEVREQNMLMRAELLRVRAIARNAKGDTAPDALDALNELVFGETLVTDPTLVKAKSGSLRSPQNSSPNHSRERTTLASSRAESQLPESQLPSMRSTRGDASARAAPSVRAEFPPQSRLKLMAPSTPMAAGTTISITVETPADGACADAHNDIAMDVSAQQAGGDKSRTHIVHANPRGTPPPCDFDQIAKLVGGKNMVGLVVGKFIKSHAQTEHNLRASLASADYAKMRRFAHTLKGACSYMAAKPTERAAKQLYAAADAAVKGENVDEAAADAIAAAIESLAATLRELLEALRAFEARHTGSGDSGGQGENGAGGVRRGDGSSN